MYWIAGGIWMCDKCGLKKPCKCDRGGKNLMEHYYTEKREKAEEQERYIRELEAENKRLRELLKEVISGHEYSWEWNHPSMDWVEVQIDKDVLREIERVLEGRQE